MPSGKLVKIGVWENNKFIGCVLFGRGASPQIGRPYSLDQTEVCELVRVALTKHKAPVTKMVSIAIKLLREFAPKLKLIVSYADPEQNHIGKIYQAGNWLYTGLSTGGQKFLINGRWVHDKSIRTGRRGYATKLREAGVPIKYCKKFKYLYPIDERVKLEVGKLRQPYPKSASVVQK